MVQERSLLKHPFYESWNKGELPLDSLREYANQYYHFESAYPTFLSGVHHRCTDREIRQLLLSNLWDEEHGDENHVELWLRFCDALDLNRDGVIKSSPSDATRQLIDTYHELTTSSSVSAGVTALYAFESQVPEVAKTKIVGLKKHYGIDNPEAISFFEVHRTLDIEHAEAERAMVQTLTSVTSGVESGQAASDATEAADTSTKALWSFLDGVY
jgi:pyrroloquinoline-quinone synthase